MSKDKDSMAPATAATSCGTIIPIRNRYSFKIGGKKVEGFGNTSYAAFLALGYSLQDWERMPADFWNLEESDMGE